MEAAMMDDLTEIESPNPADPDLPLIDEIGGGNPAAFEELICKYDRRLMRIAVKITLNLEDAQEAVEGAFLQAFQNLHQFQRTSKFSTWMIRLVVSESFRTLQTRHQNLTDPLEYENAEGSCLPINVADWAPNFERSYGRRELREILLNALDTLAPILRATFLLRDLEGLSTEETAEILSLDTAAVKARLLRARLQLREHLSRHFRLSCP
jgi:RNA polymerase sigma-70 factor, ECF subfamily